MSKVTRIRESFHILNFWRWHKLLSFGFYHECRYLCWRPTQHTSIRSQFDLSQGHSSNRHFQWKWMFFLLNRQIILRPLSPGVPYQTCGHLRWILQGIPIISSLHTPVQILLSSLWNIFIITEDTSLEELPCIHQQDQFDFCQGHSRKKHFQKKSVTWDLQFIELKCNCY